VALSAFDLHQLSILDQGVQMKQLSRWLVPILVVLVIAIVVFAASKFADQPNIFVSGDVELSPDLVEKAQGIETLFIVVYDADSPMPMPYGAYRDRVSAGSSKEVANFVLTPEKLQVMRPDAPVPKNFRVKVRLDRDGQGGQDQPGDLVGQVDRVAYGASGVHVAITQVVQ
jgi:hypothetical protein